MTDRSSKGRAGSFRAAPVQEGCSPLVADAKGLSAMGLGSIRHIRRLDASGRLPRSIKLGKRTVWSLDDIRNWLAAGAPRRELWEVLRRGEQRTC